MPNRPIRQIIHRQRSVTTTAATTITEAARLMRDARVGAVMVVDGPMLVGTFTERDALVRVLAEARDPKRTTVEEVMTRNPRTIEPDRPFSDALHIMYESGFRHVPVVENGWPVGMVSARDAIGPEMAEFEEESRVREHIAEVLG
ncbi:MAG TPA: CBS domain-containing protein [Rhodocyclaceae bacterium]|nr:CBS domain-containing protein [Rhodocyclaceae bacterium]